MIENYLLGRIQQTPVKISLSTSSLVTDGIPERSLLFLIFIEDIIRRPVAAGDVSVFVYTLRYYLAILSKLQTAIHTVEDWFKN